MDARVHSELFGVGDSVAFSLLSARRFFHPVDYCNRDHARLVIQAFDKADGGTLIRTRRRDGSTSAFFSAGVHEVRCPHHVFRGHVPLDVGLLDALCRSLEHEDWPRISQAVALFNEANTDQDFMPEAAELILSYAAIEQVLDRAGESPREVASAFEAAWSLADPVPRDRWVARPIDASGASRLGRAPSLRHTWIEDLAIARGSVAHGHAAASYRGIWSLAEHLILAAFAVPRLVKLQLAAFGTYAATDQDSATHEILEELINTPPFAERDPDTGEPHPWNRILNREAERRLARIIARELLSGPEST
jgi:hypothetical protein